MAVKSRLKDGVLHLDIPIQEPRPSGSGKTLVVATTHGVVNTGIRCEGSEVMVNANAFIENKSGQREKTRENKRRQQPTNRFRTAGC